MSAYSVAATCREKSRLNVKGMFIRMAQPKVKSATCRVTMMRPVRSKGMAPMPRATPKPVKVMICEIGTPASPINL